MKNSKKQFLLMFVILPILLITALIFYLINMTHSYENESMQSLEEVALQGVNAVQAEINNKMYLLKDLAVTVDFDFTESDESISEAVCTQLTPVVENHGLYNMGIVTSDGVVYTTEGEIITSSNLKFQDFLEDGETAISGRLLLEEDMYINIYTTPVLNKTTHEQEATLYAAYETQQFRQTLEIISYHGEGYSYMIDSNGDVVIDSNNPNAFQDMVNVYTSLENADTSNAETIRQLQEFIASGESGYITFVNRGVKKFMYCAPVGVNDWYLLTVVPSGVVNEQLYTVIVSTVFFAIIIILIYSALFVFIIKQQKKKQEELATLAYVDPLTGGFTFAKFQEEYREIMKLHPDNKYALINMDLNRFKMLNDLYGYEEGDKVIQLLELLWRKQLHECECCGHRMADRFIILLTYDERQELIERLEKYRAQLQKRADGKYKLNLIAGVYEIQDITESFETVFNRTMMAFSTAKNDAGSFITFYDEAMEEGLVWERYVEDHFQTALDNHEFQVYYQAKVNAATGKVSGAEALVRWVRSDGSVIAPGRFIPVLENNGSIAELDRYMFQEVLNHQMNWMRDGLPIVPVSVNLSRVQLAEQNFVERYKNMLEGSELPAKYISLEFTESAMFDNEEILRDTVEQLHDMGIKVLIDDFGVGFSSMMTLKAIPIDILKMDKSFVDSIGDERGNKIVVGMIEFALSLGMSVTAEGVEDEDQYQFLKTHHCHDIQGYYFSRPIPANEYCKKFLMTA